MDGHAADQSEVPTRGSTPSARPLYLTDGADPVFALFHAAAEGRSGDTAVLICPPFGFEDLCSYRSRRSWAQHLAAAGWPTLRIDLPGTGDSGGSPLDPARMPVWSEAVGSAAAWLREAGDCQRLAAIGIGLGGLVICQAILAGAAVDALVLWGVPGRGRTFIRELRAFARMRDARPTADGVPAAVMDDPGTTAAGGFALSQETTAALAQLDLASANFPDGHPGRVLLLGRDGRAADERLQAQFERIGATVSVAPGPGFTAMMAPPHDARPPVEVFALVDSWLREDSVASAGPARGASVGIHGSGDAEPTAHRAACKEGAASAQIELLVGAVPIREIPLRIAQPFGHLFAVLSEPVSQPAGDLCAVLLNAGMIHRIGPGRLWVDIARGWAARGVPTLRLDFIGVGDSDDDGHPRHALADLYEPDIGSQLKASLNALAARGLGPRFALAGLCSGSYWAFHGALLDDRVTAAFMLNPARLFWDDLLAVRRELRKGLLEPRHWRRLLRGELTLARALRFARRLPRAIISLLGGARSMRAASRSRRDQLGLALKRLREADVSVLLAFSGEESLHEELLRQGRLDSIACQPNVELGVLPGRDHTLSSGEAQRGARDLLDGALERELARAATVVVTT